MPTILIVEKLGLVRELHVKGPLSISDLYKKAGFKSADGFHFFHNWSVTLSTGKSYSISLYGKTEGKANTENKYEFPPPADTALFFGNCVLVNGEIDNTVSKSLSSDEWEDIYEFLFGGFDDLSDAEAEADDAEAEAEAEESDDNKEKTKQGYVKDGFIVEDADDDMPDTDDEEEDDDDDEEDDYDEDIVDKKVKTKKIGTKKTGIKKRNIASKKTSSKKKIVEEVVYIGCSEELSEELYDSD